MFCIHTNYNTERLLTITMLYKAITKITKLLCNSDAGNDNNNNNNQLLTQHMSVKLNWRIAVAEMIIFTYCWLVKKKIQ